MKNSAVHAMMVKQFENVEFDNIRVKFEESYGGMELLDAMDGDGCYIDKSIDYARGVREDK